MPHRNTLLTIISTFVLLTGFIVGISMRRERNTSVSENINLQLSPLQTSSTCLGNNELAEHKVEITSESKRIEYIIVLKKDTHAEVKRIFLPEDRLKDFSTLQILNCSFYVARGFQYDPDTQDLHPGGSVELWKYPYDGGAGKRLMIFYEMDIQGKLHLFFNHQFHINNTETYIALLKSTKKNLIVVMRNLHTGADVFQITDQELRDKYNLPVGIKGTGDVMWDRSYWLNNQFTIEAQDYEGLVYSATIDTATWTVKRP